MRVLGNTCTLQFLVRMIATTDRVGLSRLVG